MNKIVRFFKKSTLTKTVFFVIVTIIVPSIHGSNREKKDIEIHPKIQLIEKYLSNTDSTNALVNIENLDLANNSKKALEWSNQNFPQLPVAFSNEEDIEAIKEINEQLRNKYLNRSELYQGDIPLEQIDQLFITETTEDIILYGNFTTENFGINEQHFRENNNNVFDSLLKNSEYGIDHGYFLGSLSSIPPTFIDDENIQIKLSVPKGTKMVRVGSLEESKFILQRESTLYYAEKEMHNIDGVPYYLEIAAELIQREDFTNKIREVSEDLGNTIETNYRMDPDLIKLEPLGLNAGLIFSKGDVVAEKAFDNLTSSISFKEDHIVRWGLIFTNGWKVHTTLFDKLSEGMTLQERIGLFNKLYDEKRSDVGLTTLYPDGSSKSIITFTNLSNSRVLTDNRAIEEFAATLLHEFFHHIIHTTEFFENFPLYKSIEDSEERKEELTADVERLKGLESEDLVNLLNDSYAEEDWEEFLCEAYAAKLHPYLPFKERFPQEVVRTNRFLDNLFDFLAPTVPENLREVEVGGNSAKFTFDHSSDTISVDRYNIYQNGHQINTEPTEKDGNDLSRPNPGEYEEKIVVLAENLEQATEYEFQVSAVDEAKNESEKSTPLKIKTKDTEPPELGGNLKGSALGSTLARFNWPRPTDNVGVSEAKIRRIESSSVLDFNFLPKAETTFTVSGDVNFFTDVTIEKGKTYTYSMTALDAAGNESERSNNVIIQTSDDDDRKRNEDKSENTSSSSSTLNWGGSFNGVSASGFQLFSWFKGPGGWIFGGMIPVSSSDSSAEVSLTAGLLHMFVVIPVDKEGNPLHEGLEISVEALPNSVEGLRITDTKRTQISLEWENTNSNEEFKGNLYHDIYRDSALVATVDGSVTSYIDKALTPGTAYDYYVVTRIGEDNQSEKSLTVSGRTLDPYHDQVIRIESTLFPEEFISHSNLTGNRVSVKSFVNESTQFIKIMYDDSKKAYQLVNLTTNEVLGIDSSHPTQVIIDSNEKQDRQYWRLIDTFNDTIVIENYGSPGKVIEVNIDLIENNRTIELNDLNESSNAQQFQVLIDTESPTAPASLNYSDVTDSSVQLKWEASTDNVGVSKYEIYNQFGLVGSVDGGTLTYVVESLESATLYQFTVKAVDGSGNSSLASNEVGVTTRPKAPVNLKAGEVTESSAVLTWESGERPEVVTGYEIYKDNQLIQTVDKNSLTYKVEGLESATVYRFTIKTKAGLNNISIPSNILEIETDFDNSIITINLSELVSGAQGSGYTFSNNILSFNANSSGKDYVISSNNETDRSIIIDQDIEMTLIFNNLSIRAEQPITVEKNANVTFLIQESTENKLVAVNGSGIAVNADAKIVIDSEVDGNNKGISRIEGSIGNPAIGGALSTISIGSKADIVAVTNDSPAILSNSNNNLGDGYLVSFEIVGEGSRVDPNKIIHVSREIWKDPSGFPEREPVRDVFAPQLENKNINIAYTTGDNPSYVVMNVTGIRTGDIYDLDNRTYNFNPTKVFSPIKSDIAH